MPRYAKGCHGAWFPHSGVAKPHACGMPKVVDVQIGYPSQRAAIESIAGKIGCTPETLRRWVRQGERDGGLREGPTIEQQRMKAGLHEVRCGSPCQD